MITFLSHFFIKDYKDYSSPQVRQSYGMLCGAVGIALNIFLFIGKWLAGILSGPLPSRRMPSTTYRMQAPP